MHNIKQSDIVRHKRRGTYGIVTAVDDKTIRVVWHCGNGYRNQYDHKATTNVVELMYKYSDYGRFYEAGRTMLATYFGYKFDRSHNRSQALGAWLDSFASDKQRGLPFDEEPVSNALDKRTETVLRNVITTLTLKEFQESVGMARGAMEFQSRATGRTAGIAMAWIGEAMHKPYVWHRATDHHTGRLSQEVLYREMRSILVKLAWRGFEFDDRNQSMRFVPIVKEVTTYEAKTVITSYR